MKKIVLSSVLACLLGATSAFGFSAAGDAKVVFTGFKTAKKDKAGGTFKDIAFKSTENADFAAFAKSFVVEIDALKMDTKMPLRDKNILTLFSASDDKSITAKVTGVTGDAVQGVMKVDLTMNGITKPVDMSYTVADNKIIATGTIDVLKDYEMVKGFEAFSAKCKGLHAGKSWPDVEISFELAIK